MNSLSAGITGSPTELTSRQIERRTAEAEAGGLLFRDIRIDGIQSDVVNHVLGKRRNGRLTGRVHLPAAKHVQRHTTHDQGSWIVDVSITLGLAVTVQIRRGTQCIEQPDTGELAESLSVRSGYPDQVTSQSTSSNVPPDSPPTDIVRLPAEAAVGSDHAPTRRNQRLVNQ